VGNPTTIRPDIVSTVPSGESRERTKFPLGVSVDGTRSWPTANSEIPQEFHQSTSMDEPSTMLDINLTDINPLVAVVRDDDSASHKAMQSTSFGDVNHDLETRMSGSAQLVKEDSSSIKRIIISLLDGNVGRNVLKRRAPATAAVVAEIGQRLSHASVVDPSLLAPNQCSAIVVNYISAGYILLPFGKSNTFSDSNFWTYMPLAIGSSLSTISSTFPNVFFCLVMSFINLAPCQKRSPKLVMSTLRFSLDSSRCRVT